MPDIYDKLHKAQKGLQAVGKGSNNSYHGYSYTSAEDMLKACRTALLDAGLVCMRRSWRVMEICGTTYVESEVWIYNTGAKPKEGDETAQHLTSTFVYPVCPGNGRPIDKAVSAALTTGLSYWLRDLLLLPRVDGLEVDTRDDSGYVHQETTTQDPERSAHLEALRRDMALQIEDRATPEQMTAIRNHIHTKHGEHLPLEQMPALELKLWLDKIKKGSTNENR
jgi:hypothetical protein